MYTLAGSDASVRRSDFDLPPLDAVLAVFPAGASPASMESGTAPLLIFIPPSESDRCPARSAAPPFRGTRRPGSSPEVHRPSSVQTSEVHSVLEPKLQSGRGFASPAPFRPRRFHDLDGLLLRCLPRGFPRAPLMGFRPSGSLPSLRSPTRYRACSPSCRCAPRSRRKRGLASCAARRLQGAGESTVAARSRFPPHEGSIPSGLSLGTSHHLPTWGDPRW